MTSSHESELIDLICEQSLTDRTKLTRDATLDTLGMDSVDFVSVAFAVEDKYGVVIGDNEISREQTLGDLLDLIEVKIKAKAGAS